MGPSSAFRWLESRCRRLVRRMLHTYAHTQSETAQVCNTVRIWSPSTSHHYHKYLMLAQPLPNHYAIRRGCAASRHRSFGCASKSSPFALMMRRMKFRHCCHEVVLQSARAAGTYAVGVPA